MTVAVDRDLVDVQELEHATAPGIRQWMYVVPQPVDRPVRTKHSVEG